MKKLGAVNILAVAIVFVTIVALGFGFTTVWALGQYNRERTTVEAQEAEAAKLAKAEQKKADEAEFTEREKQPYRVYEAPAVLGAIKVTYPKTWSVYAEEEQKSGSQLEVYMHPGKVHSVTTSDDPFAFRLRLEQELYSDVVIPHQAAVEKGELKATAVKISGIDGVRYDGQLDKSKRGSLIVLPIRDKTLSIWTEAESFTGDFDTLIGLISITP